MLWFLHLASDAGLIVQAYEGRAKATGEMLASWASRFLEATLCREVTLHSGSNLDVADQLHEKVYDFCFIARSVNSPVRYVAKFWLY